MKKLFENGTILLMTGVILGSILSVSKFKRVNWTKALKELILSYFSALIVYEICVALSVSQWFLIAYVSLASYLGGRSLVFFEWLLRSTLIKTTEKHLNIDLDDEDQPNYKK